MRIRPVLLDSRPTFFRPGGRNESLLLVPFGTHTLLEYLRAWLEPVTRDVPLIVSAEPGERNCAEAIRGLCPGAIVAQSTEAIADAVAGYELSDALLIVDPRCLPVDSLALSSMAQHYAVELRVAHHLVVFERSVSGTQERVSFDGSGQVRRILRHYEPTWPFIAGVTATVLPVASGILADGVIPASLTNLRQTLALRGVPSRDVPVEGGALDLTHEAGLLAANEFVLRRATQSGRPLFASGTPVLVGQGQSVHDTARISGAVVIHADAEVGENAMVFGPAVLGPGARVMAGAVVAHSIVGPHCTVPSGLTVRNRVWSWAEDDGQTAQASDTTHGDPVLQLPAAALRDDLRALDQGERTLDGRGWAHKRALDLIVAALALVALLPVLLVVALAVWLESGGAILYGDQREGMRGRGFRCWKFRTMYVGAHAAQLELMALDTTDGPHFKVDRDPRVTRVGRILRALNLDELPQLVNVLLGEMSLVGPRPSPFRENQVCVPWREARLSVRPGITGFWQVCRHDRSAGDFHQWIEYDLLYVQHISFWLDVKILAATLLTLGGKAGHVSSSWLVRSLARQAPHGQAPAFSGRPASKSERVVPI